MPQTGLIAEKSGLTLDESKGVALDIEIESH